MNNDTDRQDGDADRDPMFSAPGADPAGTGVGAVAGELAGRCAADAFDPTREDADRRETCDGCLDVEQASSVVEHDPDCGFDMRSYGRYPGRNFDELRPRLSGDWTAVSGAYSLSWNRARHAARDVWSRLSGLA